MKATTLDQVHPEVITIELQKHWDKNISNNIYEQLLKKNLLGEEETLVAVGGVGGDTVRVSENYIAV